VIEWAAAMEALYVIADGKLTRLTTERIFTSPPSPFFASTGAKPRVSANGPSTLTSMSSRLASMPALLIRRAT
jgi:hypothetical protein